MPLVKTSQAQKHPAPPSFFDAAPDENLGLLLHFVRQAMICQLERSLAQNDLGLNFTQFRVLKTLACVPCISALELAQRLGHDAGALTRLLNNLQKRGFLHRHPSLEDRRSVEISLSDAGRALARPLRTVSDEVTRFALSELSGAEQQTLMNLLKRVRKTLESTPES